VFAIENIIRSVPVLVVRRADNNGKQRCALWKIIRSSSLVALKRKSCGSARLVACTSARERRRDLVRANNSKHTHTHTHTDRVYLIRRNSILVKSPSSPRAFAFALLATLSGRSFVLSSSSSPASLAFASLWPNLALGHNIYSKKRKKKRRQTHGGQLACLQSVISASSRRLDDQTPRGWAPGLSSQSDASSITSQGCDGNLQVVTPRRR
jgi:hypothetical protein